MQPAIMSSKSSDDRNLFSLVELSRRGLARVKGALALMAAVMLFCAIGAQAQAPAIEQSWYQLVPAASPSRALHNRDHLRCGARPDRYVWRLQRQLSQRHLAVERDYLDPGLPCRTARLRAPTYRWSTIPRRGNVVLFGGLTQREVPAPTIHGFGTEPTGRT